MLPLASLIEIYGGLRPTPPPALLNPSKAKSKNGTGLVKNVDPNAVRLNVSDDWSDAPTELVPLEKIAAVPPISEPVPRTLSFPSGSDTVAALGMEASAATGTSSPAGWATVPGSANIVKDSELSV